MNEGGKDFPLRKNVRIKRVDERITCIFLPKPNQQWSNVYLIEDENLALIDTGRPEVFSVDALRRALAHLGYGVEDIKTLIYTHSHIDHIGGGVALDNLLKSTNIAFHETVEPLKDFSRFMEEWMLEFMSLLSRCPLSIKESLEESSIYELLTFPKLENRVVIHRGVKEGDIIDLGETKLQVYHTPGHSPWDISLYEPEKRFLFTGDLITSPATVLVSTMGSNLTDYLNSLEKVGKITIDCMLPGHGRFSRKPYRLFCEVKEYIKKWEDLILMEIKKGAKNLHEITTTLFHGCNDAGIQVFNYGMIDTFLEKLRKEGRIVVDESNGRSIFFNRQSI